MMLNLPNPTPSYTARIVFRQPEITPNPRTADYALVKDWTHEEGCLVLTFVDGAEVIVPHGALERAEFTLVKPT
jgi:hypothetical protein